MCLFVTIMLTCVGIGVWCMLSNMPFVALFFLAVGFGMYFFPCGFGWTLRDEENQNKYDEYWGTVKYWEDKEKEKEKEDKDDDK